MHPDPNQIEFELERQDRDPDSLDAVIHILRTARAWMTAAQILQALGRPDTESDRRWVRRMAEDSDGAIISGQNGYRHIGSATQSEIAHACNWMLSQGKKMIHRAISTKRRAHQLIG